MWAIAALTGEFWIIAGSFPGSVTPIPFRRTFLACAGARFERDFFKPGMAMMFIRRRERTQRRPTCDSHVGRVCAQTPQVLPGRQPYGGSVILGHPSQSC